MDLENDEIDFNFTDNEWVWLRIVKAFVVILDLTILGLASFNIYNYLYKQ